MSDYRRRLAFQHGKAAALRGKPETSCNRQPGTIFYDDWHDGYREGQVVAKRANRP